ncbi:MAG TPA: M50 family metallopeptidase [Pseudobacteroides sp.]|uniref:M50 family metallopeptidase n=1 Tax=Pseudobacteroides sp. TaxID=1968840 RepID=UPI002F921B7F
MKSMGRYLIILSLILVLWNTVIIKPLKLFAVFLHELGHSLMAFVFGYGISGIRISFNESGYALVKTKGWLSQIMILNGGYLGSLFFGLLILLLKKTPIKKYLPGIIAIIFLGVSIKYGDFSLILLYSIIFAAVVIIIYMIQNDKVIDWTLDIIGVSSVAYAVYDTFVDTLLVKFKFPLQMIGGRANGSDADQLAQIWPYIPAVIWGIFWIVLSLLAIYVFLAKGGGKSKASKSKK